MKVLRIKLRQNQAVYNRAEMTKNKMTYPLPFFSTVIGALHNACGYTEYHPMDISVQGKYGSMNREVYVNHSLLNNLEDDRNILIWLSNPESYSGGYIQVVEALKNTSNSFKNRITVQTFDEEKLSEYIKLHSENERLNNYRNSDLKPKELAWKEEKKALKKALASAKDESGESDILRIKAEIAAGDERINNLKLAYRSERENLYDIPMSHFKTLAKSVQTQEVLYELELVIHVKASDEVLDDILKNQYNFVALGRSEDFIDLVEIKYVDLANGVDEDKRMPNGYRMYLNKEKVDNEIYLPANDDMKNHAMGTVYFVSKDYHIEKSRRIFNKIPCLYASDFMIDSESHDIWYDEDGGYIVDLN